jgi:hypothetical protein
MDLWEAGVQWGENDGDHGTGEDDERNWARPMIRDYENKGNMKPIEPGDDFSDIGSIHFGKAQQEDHGDYDENASLSISQIVELQTEREAGFKLLQAQLVANHEVRSKEKTTTWMLS